MDIDSKSTIREGFTKFLKNHVAKISNINANDYSFEIPAKSSDVEEDEEGEESQGLWMELSKYFSEYPELTSNVYNNNFILTFTESN